MAWKRAEGTHHIWKKLRSWTAQRTSSGYQRYQSFKLELPWQFLPKKDPHKMYPPWHCGSKRDKEGNYSKLSRWCRRASSQLCAAGGSCSGSSGVSCTGSEPNWGCLLLPTSSSRSTNTGCILRSLLGFCDSSGTKLGLPLITLQHQGAFWETPNGAKRNQEIQWHLLLTWSLKVLLSSAHKL